MTCLPLHISSVNFSAQLRQMLNRNAPLNSALLQLWTRRCRSAKKTLPTWLYQKISFYRSRKPQGKSLDGTRLGAVRLFTFNAKTGGFQFRSQSTSILAPMIIGALLGSDLRVLAQSPQIGDDRAFRKKINFISKADRTPTPNPAGWEAYDGSIYSKERGYGWIAQLTGFYASDNGVDGTVYLRGGVATSPRKLGRFELANWHGTHQENQPLVFRVDLPDGWYRVHCTSVAQSILPVVDQRNFKCRAHDSVFAGPSYGPPLKVRGRDLVEGSHIVEVTEKNLRIVVGDPAYAGWTWTYNGPWYRGWSRWWGEWGDHRYAENWYQKLTRVVDPGFHHLRLNSLEIERIPGPFKRPALLFRDFFNRDDSSDINSGVTEANQWIKVGLSPANVAPIESELYKTSLKLIGPKNGQGSVGVIQKNMSPETGIIRYSTRVSLFTGEGSKIHSGFQEAGLLILGESKGPTEFNSTFIGVAFDRNRAATPGSVRYRVGNGQNGYKTNLEISDTVLPFRVTEGEYEIMVDHDLKSNLLKRIQINGKDLTGWFSLGDRKQRIARGLFGIRASMDPLGSGVSLQQFYWYHRVEDIARIEPSSDN